MPTVLRLIIRHWSSLVSGLLAFAIVGFTRPAAADNAADLAEVERLQAQVVLLRDAGRSADAIPVERRALALAEKVLGPAHADVGERVGDLAVLLDESGDYAGAEPLFRRALAIQEKTLGPKHASFAATLNNLAILLDEKGDYAGAEPLLRRALTICEETRGPDHPDVAIYLNSLGGLLKDKGDVVGAEQLIRRALAIREKSLGPEHLQVAEALNNLGSLLTYEEKNKEAEPLLRRALAIREKALGPDHPSLASSLSNLADLLRAKGDRAGAEQLYRRALAIREKAQGPNHPELAGAISRLARVLQAQKDYAGAEPLYRRALAIREKSLGPDHPYLATNLSNLGAVLQAKGDYAAAEPLEARALDIDDHQALRVLQTGSLRQKQAFFDTLLGDTSNAISFHTQGRPTSQSALDLALRTILRRKGLAEEVGGAGLRALEEHADPADRKQLAELSSRRAELARATLSSAAPGTSPTQRHAALETMAQEVERLERELSARYAALRVDVKATNVKAVQAALPTGSALVEYAFYKPFDPRGNVDDPWGFPRYVAYILPAHGEAKYAELGDALPIERAVAVYRDELVRQTPNFERAARTLDALIMEPVRAQLDGASDVYVAPDGVLNLVPFASLLDEQGHYLVENYRFNLLTTGRDLLRYRGRLVPRSPPLVLGGPAYGVRRGGAEPSDASRGTSELDFNRVYFPPLEGTLREARDVGKLLPHASVLTDGEATEGALKRAHAPRILHIATHGFFLGSTEYAARGQRGLELSIPRDDAGEPVALPDNPMLRSGLAFAGANLRESGNDDGILTALEASALDLWGTQLVVLSGCETGVGEVNNGDGVYGLRRALVVSGSETQLMSLWKVDDESTRALMTDYYRRVLDGAGRVDALRQVQLAMLARPATRHPYYWAAFIAAGDGRTLDYRPAPAMQMTSADGYKVEPKRGGCACGLADLDERPSAHFWALLSAVLTIGMIRRKRREPSR